MQVVDVTAIVGIVDVGAHVIASDIDLHVSHPATLFSKKYVPTDRRMYR